MHELSITQSIVNIAVETAKEHNVKKIREIHLRIGEVLWHCVSVRTAIFRYPQQRHRRRGGSAGDEDGYRSPCAVTSAGAENEIDKLKIQCPACGSTDLKLLTGHEFYVESLEVD